MGFAGDSSDPTSLPSPQSLGNFRATSSMELATLAGRNLAAIGTIFAAISLFFTVLFR
jgi:drug/metabolite transporter superfamily protein YnfA